MAGPTDDVRESVDKLVDPLSPSSVAATVPAAVPTTSAESPAPEPLLLATVDPPLETRATHRRLMLHGLASDEAAQLTAFIAGIDTAHTWSLPEINRLLFMRILHRADKSLS